MRLRFRTWMAYGMLAATLAAVYGLTLAPGYTWANRAADAGDLITAAYTGGVAHPPGYPTYLLLARLFQYLPFGTLALRTNLLSALCAVLAALFLMALVSDVGVGTHAVRLSAGFIAGLALGLSPLFWSQAVITEVYSLNVLFITLILWLMFAPSGEVGSLNAVTWRERLIGLLFGLALGNHLTVILLLPVWLLLAEARSDSGTATVGFQVDGKALARRFAWLIVGLLVYGVIPLRARSGSPVNWGGATDWQGLWWLISGQLYQGRLFALDGAVLLARLSRWAALLPDQFGWMGLGLALLGMVGGHVRSTVKVVAGWMALAYSGFALVYNIEDWYVLLLPLSLALALSLGVGVVELLTWLSKRSVGPRWVQLCAAAILALIALHAVPHFEEVNARQDDRAERFARAVLADAPQGALLQTQEDADTFTLWYYHFALGHRPDLILLHEGLLAYGWYRQQMTAYYPQLVLPQDWDCFSCTVKQIPRLNHRPYCQTRPDADEPLLCW